MSYLRAYSLRKQTTLNEHGDTRLVIVRIVIASLVLAHGILYRRNDSQRTLLSRLYSTSMSYLRAYSLRKQTILKEHGDTRLVIVLIVFTSTVSAQEILNRRSDLQRTL